MQGYSVGVIDRVHIFLITEFPEYSDEEKAELLEATAKQLKGRGVQK